MPRGIHFLKATEMGDVGIEGCNWHQPYYHGSSGFEALKTSFRSSRPKARSKSNARSGPRPEGQSSIALRTRSVTSAGVAFHSNGTTIQPSNSLERCLPAATTAASSSALRSRGIVSEAKIVIGTVYDYRNSGVRRPVKAVPEDTACCPGGPEVRSCGYRYYPIRGTE